MTDIEGKTAKSHSEKAEHSGTRKIQVPSEIANAFLEEGSVLTKARSFGRRYQRHYYVDMSSLRLAYLGSKKFRKRPDRDKIPVKDIVEIREGVQKQSGKQKEGPSFTLVVGHQQMKTVTFIAPSDDVRAKWIRELRDVVQERKVKDPVKRERIWLRESFSKANRTHDNVLDKREIASRLKSLNVPSEIRKYAKKRASRGKMNVEEFFALYNEVRTSTELKEEMKEIFSKYASDQAGMNASELAEFFRKEQNQDFAAKELEGIIARSEQSPDLRAQNLLSPVGFSVMFLLPEMNIKQLKCRGVYQDMTQPLSHYFINSSHNTYLEGHQLYGNSSSQQYDRVLTQRCRCLELDVWDGDEGDPIIHHGYTLTTKILFKDALKAIRKSAFQKSEYPVILSIENHCSVEQQIRMAEHLKEVFGDALLVESLPEGNTALPSPEQLKGRVIVKGKKLAASAVNCELAESESDEAADAEDEEVKERVKKFKKKQLKLAQELSDCVVICQKMHFKSFDDSAGKFLYMSSFDENEASKLMEEDGGCRYVEHNACQLSRVYPGGLRVDSSNYDPVPMWMAGCQVRFISELVAVHFIMVGLSRLNYFVC